MRPFAILLTLSAAPAASAHEGVKNPAVMARMHGMKEIAAHLKVIGDMAKGERTFQAETARSAAAGIATHAAAAPALFEAPEDDPKSEAKPAIWESFDKFTALSLEMEAIAVDLAETIATPDDLGTALQRLGQNCKACHTDYRE